MKKPKLFLLHFAGGNCNSFNFLIPFLKNFSVTPLELPGRGKRIDENFANDMLEATIDIYNQILSLIDDTEFAIYGHSLGAILALRVAVMLEQTNKFPVAIFVSGNPGPNIKNRKKHSLTDEELIEELTNWGGAPKEVLENRDFMNYLIPILRNDLRIAEDVTYYEASINLPIFAMMGERENNAQFISNWKKFTKSTFKFWLFKGGHFFIHSYPEEISSIITNNFKDFTERI